MGWPIGHPIWFLFLRRIKWELSFYQLNQFTSLFAAYVESVIFEHRYLDAQLE